MRKRGRTLLALAGLILLAMPALAAEPPAAGDDAPAAEPAASRTYVVNGTTITWNPGRKQYQAPSAEQHALLAQALAALLAEKAAAGKLPLTKKAEVEVLPNGMRRLRATPDMINVALVRVGRDGELVAACTDDPEAARQALAAPLREDGEER